MQKTDHLNTKILFITILLSLTFACGIGFNKSNQSYEFSKNIFFKQVYLNITGHLHLIVFRLEYGYNGHNKGLIYVSTGVEF